MNKILIIIFALFLLLPGICFAQNPIVTIPDFGAPAGKEINIDILVSDLSGLQLFSMDFIFIYDHSLLALTGVTSSGSVTSGWGTPTVNSVPGQINIAFAGVEPLAGSGRLIRMRFFVAESASAGSTSPLRLLNFKFNEGQPQAVTNDGLFTVTSDSEAPGIISGPSIRNVGYFNVSLFFRTDEPSRTEILYGETSEYGQNIIEQNLSVDHLMVISDLRETSTYHYQIQITDSIGNGPAISSDFTFRTKNVTLSLPDLNLDPGTNVEIPVTIPDFSGLNIKKIALEMYFDQSQIQISGINTNNSVLSTWPAAQVIIVNGKLTFQAENSAAITGGGNLFILNGQVPVSADLNQFSDLSWGSVELNDGTIRLIANNGSVTVKDNALPIISTGPGLSALSSRQVTIQWQTNEPANSLIDFGESVFYSFHRIKQQFVTDHEFILTNLLPGKTYHYRVGGEDVSGNGPTWSSDKVFITPNASVSVGFPDSTAAAGLTIWLPLNTSDLTGYSVTNWEGLVGYDPEKLEYIGYDQNGTVIQNWPPVQVLENPGFISVTASGSTELTGYGALLFFGFKIKDITGLKKSRVELLSFLFDQGWPVFSSYDGNLTLVGSGDNNPPQIVAGPFTDHITDNSARIFWQVNELSSGTIEYGSSANYDHVSQSTKFDSVHLFILTGLQANTTYSYHVKNRDELGNESPFSADYSFTTLAGNSLPVFILDLSAQPGSIIDIPIRVGNLSGQNVYSCDMTIEYNQALLTAISVTGGSLSSGWGEPLFSLFPGQIVIAMGGVQTLQGEGTLVKMRFRVSDLARAGDLAKIRFSDFIFNDGIPLSTSGSGTIRILDIVPPKLVSGPNVFNIRSNSAIITWLTDEPSDSRVYFGVNSAEENVITVKYIHSAHAINLQNLLTDTVYKYRIASYDSADNQLNSNQIYQFRTLLSSVINLSIDSFSTDRNELFWSTISVSGNPERPLFSVEFELAFDPDVLEYVDFLLSAPGTGNWSSESLEIRAGRIFFLLRGDTPVTEENEFIKFKFLTKNAPYGSRTVIEIKNIFINDDSSNITHQSGLFQLIDTLPPRFILTPHTSQVKSTSAKISWQADEPVTGYLVYGLVGGSSDTINIFTPAVKNDYYLTNLNLSSVYQYQVGMIDSSGNGPVWSNTGTFTTTAGDEVDMLLPDTTLVIGDRVLIPLKIKTPGDKPILSYQFILKYQSDLLEFIDVEQTGSLTENWPDPLSSTASDSLLVSNSFNQGISQSGNLLFLRFVIRSVVNHNREITLNFSSFIFNDGSPPAAVTNGLIFCEDKSAPQFVILPEITQVRLKSVKIKLKTNEPSSIRIKYGLTAVLDSLMNYPGLDTLHLIELTGLSPNQLYYYQVEAFDSLGNGPEISEIQTFKTAEISVHISIPDISVSINSEFILPVIISDVTDFGITGYQCEISYDSNLLNFLGVIVDSSLSAAWGNGMLSTETDKIIFSHSGNEALTESGILFRLKFFLSEIAIFGDSSVLGLPVVNFQEGLVPATVESGVVYFEPEILPGIVEISLPHTTASPDSSIIVQLNLTDVTGFDIRSYSFLLHFDHKLLELEEIISANTITAEWARPTMSEYGDSLFIEHSGTTSLQGAGELLSFRFFVKPETPIGSRPDLKISGFRFGTSNPEVIVNNGSISVIDFQTTTIWGYIKDGKMPDIFISGAQIFLSYPEDNPDPADQRDQGDQPVNSTFSDSSGFFSFSFLSPSVLYKLYAAKSGYSDSDTSDIFTGDLPVTLLLFKLDGFISGRIFDAENGPIENALIIANDFNGHYGSVNSDKNGEFEIVNLDSRFLYQVSVSKSGYIKSVVENITTGSVLEVKLDIQMGRIFGQTMNPENQPVSNVKIKFFNQDSGLLVTEVLTDTNGGFVKDSLKADTYLITAQKTGFIGLPNQQIVDLGFQNEKRVDFLLKPYQLQSVKISGDFSIPNDHPAYFSYTALTKAGETVSNLADLEWVFIPESAGSIADGMVSPDSAYIGQASLILRENNSAISDTADLIIFANIFADRSYVLHDAAGMELILPENSIESSFELRFDPVQPRSIKSSTKKHLIVGTGYDFKPDGAIFLKPISLKLPVPEIYRDQQLFVGQWNPNRAEWTILGGNKNSIGTQIEIEIEHFSLFSLLLPSRPLGIHGVTFTPNPFSPEIDSDGDGELGVLINFSVSSNTIRQPFVTIEIYSMLGELVREIIINQPVEKGQIYSFNWDGKTDMGRFARNGRYLVKIESKDEQGTKTYLGRIVLVK